MWIWWMHSALLLLWLQTRLYGSKWREIMWWVVYNSRSSKSIILNKINWYQVSRKLYTHMPCLALYAISPTAVWSPLSAVSICSLAWSLLPMLLYLDKMWCRHYIAASAILYTFLSSAASLLVHRLSSVLERCPAHFPFDALILTLCSKIRKIWFLIK